MSYQGVSEKNGSLTNVPLSPTPENPDQLAEPSSARVTSPDHNPDETRDRYNHPPFRRYSLLPGTGKKDDAVRRQPSKASSLLNRLLQRQDKSESWSNGDDGVTRGRSRRRKEDYSLAGPKAEQSESEEEGDEDLGYENGQKSRPRANYSLGQPFPKNNRSRWARNLKGKGGSKNQAAEGQPKRNEGGTRVEGPSDSGKPQGQVGGGPAGHHGSPVRGRPDGETSGGPAGQGRNPEDEDEAGNSNWVEQLADGANDYSATGRHDSEQTLTESTDSDEEEKQVPNYWFSIRRRIREPLAEWLGTLVSVLIGVCGNLQVKTSNGKSGSFSQSAAMWGIGTMMAVYIAGGVSGAHCNPMVSIVLSVFRGFPMRKVLIYICAQILGAICAVWIAYGIYHDAIMNYDPGKTSTSSGTGTAFFTLPAPFATPATAFMTDFTSAAVMCGTVLAMGDDTNSPPGAGMHAFILALIGFAMASTLGYNTGPQTNPAKDLATRFVPNVVGYGSTMWADGWWAEAWTAAIIGGLTGALIYDLAIFEGPESPVNYPRVKRKKARQGTKGKWLATGWFGKEKKHNAKKDLEAGNIGIMERMEERRLDGHTAEESEK